MVWGWWWWVGRGCVEAVALGPHPWCEKSWPIPDLSPLGGLCVFHRQWRHIEKGGGIWSMTGSTLAPKRDVPSPSSSRLNRNFVKGKPLKLKSPAERSEGKLIFQFENRLFGGDFANTLYSQKLRKIRMNSLIFWFTHFCLIVGPALRSEFVCLHFYT